MLKKNAVLGPRQLRGSRKGFRGKDAAVWVRRYLKQALHYINEAYRNFRPDQAIHYVLQATDAIADITDPTVVEARLAMDAWLRYAGTTLR